MARINLLPWRAERRKQRLALVLMHRAIAAERLGEIERPVRGLEDRLEPAPGRAVGLGEHQRHLETGGQQTGQRHTGEFRRAGKNEFHERRSRPDKGLTPSSPPAGP